jgi:hypothetical protein
MDVSGSVVTSWGLRRQTSIFQRGSAAIGCSFVHYPGHAGE